MKRTESHSVCGFDLKVDVYSPDGGESRAWIFYLHGGGVLYGVRDDLPSAYVECLEKAGCTLWCPDYPLAPETTLAETSEAVVALWERFCAEAEKAGTTKLFAFGRSAGAFLALSLAKRLRSTALRMPDGIVSLYGYYDLSDSFLSEPARRYCAYPAISEGVARTLVRKSATFYEPLSSRFALYVYARQTGKWAELLGCGEGEKAALSLDDDDIENLPPLFIAASADDGDVPYACSKTLARKAPDAQLVTVYRLEHDFDRDSGCREATNVYARMAKWIEAFMA